MLDALSGCCSGLKSSFLIFSLNSGEEIHYIIADNHMGYSVEKTAEENTPQWDPHREQ